MTSPADLAAALKPLTDRVRKDVTAVKTADGRQAWTREGLTMTRLLAHIDGGAARGVSQIKAGESVTRCAVLDLDSHGGATSWPEMVAVADRLISTLSLVWGIELTGWRSSGGRGIHLYALWDEPQDAYSVREAMRQGLEACGLRSGTKGVQAGECEIFPKQNEVAADGFGNQVILPFSGLSVPLLDVDLVGWEPGERDDASPGMWRLSDPVPVLARPERRVASGPVAGFDELQELLSAIPNLGEKALGYDDWFKVVAAIHHETGGSDAGLQLAHEFSAKSAKHEPGFLDERVWPHIRSDRGAVVGLGTLKRIASGHGWAPKPDASVFDDISATDDRPPLMSACPHGVPHRWACEVCDSTVPDLTSAAAVAATATSSSILVTHLPQSSAPPPPTALPAVKRRGIPEAHHLTTDQANANRIVKAFGRQVFVAAGRWHVWDGRRWLADEADVYRYGCQLSDLIRSEARAIKATASASADVAAIKKANETAEALGKWALRSEMKATIEAAIGLARKMLTIDEGLLDRDPAALNVLNGVVDLRTGELRGHNPDDFITKLVPVRYVQDAQAPTWERVLLQITREDGSSLNGSNANGSEARVRPTPLASFLRRWAGYCLTGMVTEQAFVVHWGGGSNGKSTVLDIWAETLGDYAGTAPPGLMAQSKSDRHPTEIASLMGKRMVTAHESGEGVVLREDFIKQATGGDKLTARYMRGDFFDFAPTHKLQLLTNHKPQVKGQDRGIWRRVLLVPYLASFGSTEAIAAGRATHLVDVDLVARLRNELEGILAWRVRGAVEWFRDGLQPPAVVMEASQAYKAEQDRVGQFVSECCERDVLAMEPLTEAMGGLYPAYVSWCKDGGVFPLSKARFAEDVLRVVGAAKLIERRTPIEGGRRRQLMMVPGLRLLAE